MAITATNLTLVKKPGLATSTILLNPADQLEASSEATYNLTQDAVRDGFRNLANGSSSHTFYETSAQYINAQGGDDTITLTSDADDIVHAGSGHDKVDGGVGNDKLYGGSGDDHLIGNFGNDTLSGGSGFDTLDCGFGNDSASGGSGDDDLYGDAGNDTLNGGSGRDSLYGGEGRDTVVGGTGDDELYGDKYWADAFFTNGVPADDDSANDILRGGDGNDILVGGEGADVMTGGIGADTFQFKAIFDFDTSLGTDVITDFNRAEGDLIDMTMIDGPELGNGLFANQRLHLHFEEGPTSEQRSLWLGEVDANGDQLVYINWNEGGASPTGDLHEHMFKVHVGVGQSLQASDFLF